MSSTRVILLEQLVPIPNTVSILNKGHADRRAGDHGLEQEVPLRYKSLRLPRTAVKL